MSWRDRAHYINSTDVNTARPHVTAQWDDDDLVEITISQLGDDDRPLTYQEFVSAWETAQGLKAGRERAGS